MSARRSRSASRRRRAVRWRCSISASSIAPGKASRRATRTVRAGSRRRRLDVGERDADARERATYVQQGFERVQSILGIVHVREHERDPARVGSGAQDSATRGQTVVRQSALEDRLDERGSRQALARSALDDRAPCECSRGDLDPPPDRRRSGCVQREHRLEQQSISLVRVPALDQPSDAAAEGFELAIGLHRHG